MGREYTGGAANCSEGFVISFLKDPPACLGRMAAAVQHSGLGNSQKFVYKTFGTSGRPSRYSVSTVQSQGYAQYFFEGWWTTPAQTNNDW